MATELRVPQTTRELRIGFGRARIAQSFARRGDSVSDEVLDKIPDDRYVRVAEEWFRAYRRDINRLQQLANHILGSPDLHASALGYLQANPDIVEFLQRPECAYLRDVLRATDTQPDNVLQRFLLVLLAL